VALTRSESRSRLRRGGDKEAMESAGMMRWLLTYADMITLLLALFIILFAISNISAVKFNRLAREISGGFSNTSYLNQPPNGGITGAQHGRGAVDANMVAVKAQLDQYIARQRLQSKVQTRIDKQGLIITLLSDKTYYDSGSADLRPETKQLLDVVAGQLRNVRNEVRVEGSTDNVPIATYAYPTNWELSAARATGVTRYLVEHAKIVPTRISFAGYGEFHPKYANDSDAHRQQNRRVDIVILNGAAAPTPLPEAQ
jgi:chemotaxis protein MotB